VWAALFVLGCWGERMRRPVELTTGFPSAAKAAKRLGVTKREAQKLALLAERSRKSGEFILPTAGRLILKKSKLTKGLTAQQAIRIFTRDVANSKSSRISKAAVPVKKK
jgi:hypothetical protein